jgi:predicted protein tyrosine phosphatase
MIHICGIDAMPAHAAALRPSHLVSLVEAEAQPPTPRVAAVRHLRVEIHDISEPVDDYVVPAEHHVRSLIEFVGGWSGRQPLLVHCIAGISRSTAAALVTLAMQSDETEEEAARRLRAAAPHAQPNRRIIALADALLGRGGRLVRAREAMGPAIPVLCGPLVSLPVRRRSPVAGSPLAAATVPA